MRSKMMKGGRKGDREENMMYEKGGNTTHCK